MEGVPELCPGVESEEAGRADACQGCPNQSICSSTPKTVDPDISIIASRMQTVSHTILVLSGKGGVGKSTVASQLAFSLANNPDIDVGLLDIDICGPSIPRMLGLEGEDVHQSGAGWSPVYLKENLGVMSIGFMLPSQDDAVIWRGPRKNALIKQFIKDVDWGHLDYLIVDAPPGTSDEHISIAQFLKGAKVDGALIVTTPQEVAMADVRKEINFCKKVDLPVIGLIENMSTMHLLISQLSFHQNGSDVTAVVRQLLEREGLSEELSASVTVLESSDGGGKGLAARTNIPFLGSIPMDPAISRAAEEGHSMTEISSPAAKAIAKVVSEILKSVDNNDVTSQ